MPLFDESPQAQTFPSDKDIARLEKFYELYAPVRAQEVAFYERLVLLVTGTIAITLTAVIGGLHTRITHPRLLRAGFGWLFVSVLLLLARNFTAMRHEKRIRDALAAVSIRREPNVDVVLQRLGRVESADNVMAWFAGLGVLAMVAGFFLLMVVTVTLT